MADNETNKITWALDAWTSIISDPSENRAFLEEAKAAYDAAHDVSWDASVASRISTLESTVQTGGAMGIVGRDAEAALNAYNPDAELVQWGVENILPKHEAFLKAAEEDFNSIHGDHAWQKHVATQKQEVNENAEDWNLRDFNPFVETDKEIAARFDENTVLAEWGHKHMVSQQGALDWSNVHNVDARLDGTVFKGLDGQNPVSDDTMFDRDTDFGKAFLGAAEVLYEERHGEPWSGTDQDLAAYAEGQVQWFESNLASAGNTLLGATDRAQVSLLYLTTLNSFTESTWSDTGSEMWRGAVDLTFLAASAASIGSAGTAAATAFGARYLAQLGIRQSIQKIIIASATGAISGMVEGAISEVALETGEQAMQIDHTFREEYDVAAIRGSAFQGAAMGLLMGAGFSAGGRAIANIVPFDRIFSKLKRPTAPTTTADPSTASSAAYQNFYTLTERASVLQTKIKDAGDSPLEADVIAMRETLTEINDTFQADGFASSLKDGELAQVSEAYTSIVDGVEAAKIEVETAAPEVKANTVADAQATAANTPLANAPKPSVAGLTASVANMGQRLKDAVPFTVELNTHDAVATSPSLLGAMRNVNIKTKRAASSEAALTDAQRKIVDAYDQMGEDVAALLADTTKAKADVKARIDTFLNSELDAITAAANDDVVKGALGGRGLIEEDAKVINDEILSLRNQRDTWVDEAVEAITARDARIARSTIAPTADVGSFGNSKSIGHFISNFDTALRDFYAVSLDPKSFNPAAREAALNTFKDRMELLRDSAQIMRDKGDSPLEGYQLSHDFDKIAYLSRNSSDNINSLQQDGINKHVDAAIQWADQIITDFDTVAKAEIYLQGVSKRVNSTTTRWDHGDQFVVSTWKKGNAKNNPIGVANTGPISLLNRSLEQGTYAPPPPKTVLNGNDENVRKMLNNIFENHPSGENQYHQKVANDLARVMDEGYHPSNMIYHLNDAIHRQEGKSGFIEADPFNGFSTIIKHLKEAIHDSELADGTKRFASTKNPDGSITLHDEYAKEVIYLLNRQNDRAWTQNPETQKGPWFQTLLGRSMGEEKSVVDSWSERRMRNRAASALRFKNTNEQQPNAADGGKSSAQKTAFTAMWLNRAPSRVWNYAIGSKIDWTESLYGEKGFYANPVGFQYTYKKTEGSWKKKAAIRGLRITHRLTGGDFIPGLFRLTPNYWGYKNRVFNAQYLKARNVQLVATGASFTGTYALGSVLQESENSYLSGVGHVMSTPGDLVFGTIGGGLNLAGVSIPFSGGNNNTSPPPTTTHPSPVNQDRLAQALDMLQKQIKDDPTQFSGITFHPRSDSIANEALVSQFTQKAAELAAGDTSFVILMTSDFTPYWNAAIPIVERDNRETDITKKLERALKRASMQPLDTHTHDKTILNQMVDDTSSVDVLTLGNTDLVKRFSEIQANIEAARVEAPKTVLAWFNANSPEFKALSDADKDITITAVAGKLLNLQKPSGAFLVADDFKDLSTIVVTIAPDTGVKTNKTIGAIFAADKAKLVPAAVSTTTPGTTATPPGGGATPPGGGATPGGTPPNGSLTALLGPNAPSATLAWAETKQAGANMLNTLLDHNNDGVGAHIDTDIGRTISGGVQSLLSTVAGAHGELGKTPNGQKTLNGIYAFGGALFAPFILSKLPGFGWLNARGVRPLVMIVSFFLGMKALNDGGIFSGKPAPTRRVFPNRKGETAPKVQKNTLPPVIDANADGETDDGSGEGVVSGGGDAGGFVMNETRVSVSAIQRNAGTPEAMDALYREESAELSDIEKAIAENDNTAQFAVQSANVNGRPSEFGSQAAVNALSLATNGGAHLSNAVMNAGEERKAHITAIDVNTGDVKTYDLANNAVMIGAEIAAAELAATNVPSAPKMAS